METTEKSQMVGTISSVWLSSSSIQDNGRSRVDTRIDHVTKTARQRST